MAVAPYTTASTQRLQPPPPPSCGTKLYSGLKPQSASPFGAGKPNLTAEFYAKVHKSLQCRSGNHKAARGQIQMMPIGTPKVPYRTPGEGTWQWVDLWNALYRERVIFIGQEIDEEFSNQILATMLYLDSIDNSKKLFMYINGPGGDLTPSMAIYDTMQSLKSPVSTHCVGYAYNLAAFLLAAGEKGDRLAMPLSRIALQSPAGSARGQADDIRNEANELLRIRDYLFSELSKKTGQPVEKINKDLSRMKRFNSQEALEYGLIDRIVRPPRIKADMPRKEAGTGLGYCSSQLQFLDRENAFSLTSLELGRKRQ
ncbi:ATP-dependent Clp protease proteolytic subunit-related protein 2, chloroplastic [Senna tora]|uniref:ATP-dependent Clp protease proteolytic subunit n=1 Tax=Senna tora TaxID=362788 RepID=A0A834WP97_9FABA|nr:ATP-dependent Clp protease proteolytic subunit-related protein 2, chloroplastic [Senna tora]